MARLSVGPRRLSFAAAINLGLAALVGLLVLLVGMGYSHLADSIAAARLIVQEYLPAQELLNGLDESVRTGLQRFERYHRRERVTPRRVLGPIDEMLEELARGGDAGEDAAAQSLLARVEEAKESFQRSVEAESAASGGWTEERWVESRQALGAIRLGLGAFARAGGDGQQASAAKLSRLVRLAEAGLRDYQNRDRMAIQDVVESLERALSDLQRLDQFGISAAAHLQVSALEESIRKHRAVALQYGDDERRSPSESMLETLRRLWERAEETSQTVRGGLQSLTAVLTGHLEELENGALRSAQARQRWFGAIAALGVGLAVLISFLLGRTLAGRIREVVAGSGELAAGNLGYRLPALSQDALGRLSVAFNHMAERLQEREGELQLLGTALGQADDAVLVMDAQGKAQYCNPAFAAISGYLCSEVVGRNFRDAESVNEIDRFLRRVLRDAAAHGGSWTERGRVAPPGSSAREVDLKISPVRDDSGTVRHLVAVLRDITQQAGLEEHLRETQKMQAIGTLAGGIAHDFNNLLLPIMAYGSMVLEDLPEGSKARRRQAAILRSAEQAQELITQLQRFSRPEEERLGPMPLGALAKEVAKLIRSTLPEHIEIEASVDPAAPPVWAEPTQVHQVLLNLLSNAVHAMGKTRGTIRVEVTVPEEPLPEAVSAALHERGAVCLSVTDVGEGMGPEIMQRIFEPFFTTKAPGEGSGLGLSVAHRIVDDHGGALTVESVAGQGTTFRVYLPVSGPTQALDQTNQTGGPEAAASAGKG